MRYLEAFRKGKFCFFYSPNHQDHHTKPKYEATKLENMLVGRNYPIEKNGFQITHVLHF